jgi:hypothetical protein
MAHSPSSSWRTVRHRTKNVETNQKSKINNLEQEQEQEQEQKQNKNKHKTQNKTKNKTKQKQSVKTAMN